jgi:dUTP pyrophosphatase
MSIVEIKRLRSDVEIPQYQTEGSAAFDLAPADDVRWESRSEGIKLVPTGLVIATPPDHFLWITFRSSTPRKWGVTILNGVVDSDYSGDNDELKLQVANIDLLKLPYIPAGTRIAQGIIVPCVRAYFLEVDSMGASRGGFGSTG